MNVGANLTLDTKIEGLVLKKVLRLALPRGTVVPDDAAFLARRVTGVRTLGAGQPVPTRVPDGELWLSAPEVPAAAGGPGTLVARAAANNVAALATAGAVSLEPEIPLLQLPDDTLLERVEKDVRLLLTEPALQLERRGAQLYQVLARLSTENRGLEAIGREMASLSGNTVVVAGAYGVPYDGSLAGGSRHPDQPLALLQQVMAQDLAGRWEEAEPVLRDPSHLPERMRDTLRWEEDPPPAEFQILPVTGLARYVAPILVGQRVRGFVSVVGLASNLDALDALVARYGAPVCALELAKSRAIREAEKRMQGDFMDELLAGRLTRQEALYRARRLQLDERAPHVSLSLAWQDGTGRSSRRLEGLVRQVLASRRTVARILLRGERVLIMLATPEADPIDYAFDLAQSVVLEAGRQLPGVKVSIGIGRPVKELVDWPASHQDATWACTVAQRLASGTPLFFGDLGVYRLLGQLEGGQELRAFCDRVLGSLVAYDRQHNAELIETLETYFACHGNASQTAQRLHIHRNTLLYRLARIAELTTIDLENEESRLAVHVALKVRRLLSSARREKPTRTE